MQNWFKNISTFVFLTVFFFVFSQEVSGQTVYDKAKFEKIIDAPINEITSSPRGIVWVIAGNNNKVVRIKRQKFIREYFFESKYQNIYFTTIYCLPNGSVLVGTKEHYLFYIKGKNSVQIDCSYGLTDSTILKIYFNNNTKNLELTTPNNVFTLENPNSSRRLRCVLKGDDETIFDAFSKAVRNSILKPIQKSISTFASELDYSGRSKKYIGTTELDSVLKVIKPGDIILKRDNYFLSNIGIEGFWTHSGIYIGSIEDLDKQFSKIELVGLLSPSQYLQMFHPLIFQLMEGRKNLIIEAVGKGVSINPIEHIALVDYLSVLRPNLPKEDIFKSMLISFEYLGFPYDFLFDFRTDNEVVCSELVYLSYRPRSDKAGITFPFSEVLGLPFVSPNDIARLFSEEYGNKNQSLSFVIFCDADNEKEKTVFKDSSEYINSWKR